MKTHLISALSTLLLLGGCHAPEDGQHVLHVLTTNDIHGAYFDSTYVDGSIRPSMLSAYYYIDSLRSAVGADNVLLIDAGDFLQGDNASYFFNYMYSTGTHVFSRMAEYMGYDAIIAGNHDIETGHDVYDRISDELAKEGIPFLAGNAIRNDNGKPYFPVYSIFKRAGLKVAVLGFDNANIKAWLDESLWKGMHFESLLPLVQDEVDKVIAKEKPQVVIVAVHSGTGNGDGEILESQGLDLFQSLQGVDVVVCAHDHRPFVREKDGIALVNAGSHCRNLGHATVSVGIEQGKVAEKSASAELIAIDPSKSDARMKETFQADYEMVKAFTLKEVGELLTDLDITDAFRGMSDYIDFIHTVELESCPADISLAAPLNSRGIIKAGTLVYNDLFTLYQYENQLFLISMSGAEVKRYLEASYDQWIRTVSGPEDHVLNIENRADPRSRFARWSFSAPTFNFDSMAGINYTVDVTKPFGERIDISSMADGSAFDEDATYKVALTSYRASGGGGLLDRAGVDSSNIDERVIGKYPEIRDLMYDYLTRHGSIDPQVINDASVIGHWEFVPAKVALPGIERDMELVYGDGRGLPPMNI